MDAKCLDGYFDEWIKDKEEIHSIENVYGLTGLTAIMNFINFIKDKENGGCPRTIFGKQNSIAN